MDRKILTSFFAGLVSVLFVSCEKDANIPVPQQEPKLVVYSYISPQDTVIEVSVTSSNSVFGNDNPDNNIFTPVSNATVIIHHNGNSYTLVYNPMYARYHISPAVLPVVAGQSYLLTVSAPGYETVEASTTVPQYNNFEFTTTFLNKTAPVNSAFNSDPARFTFEVSWKHYRPEDYYRVSPHFYYVDTTGIIVADTIIQEYQDHFYNESMADGGRIIDRIQTGSVIHEEPFGYPHGFYYDLVVSGYDYYKFHESLNYYSSGDPFAEPSLIYTNMKNGYGIFAGYLKTTRRTDF